MLRDVMQWDYRPILEGSVSALVFSITWWCCLIIPLRCLLSDFDEFLPTKNGQKVGFRRAIEFVVWAIEFFLVALMYLSVFCDASNRRIRDHQKNVHVQLRDSYPRYPYTSCGSSPSGWNRDRNADGSSFETNGTGWGVPCYLLNGSIWVDCRAHDFWNYTKAFHPQYYDNWKHPIPKPHPTWKLPDGHCVK